MTKPSHDKNPFTGENSTDAQCPVCKQWVLDVQKHARIQVDPEHAVLVVHLS